MVEVLSVDADDEGREEDERRDHGELLHDVVLVVRDLSLVVVADRGDRVAREVEAVDRAQELVVHLREVELDLAREDLAPEDAATLEVGPAVDDPADGVARRPERPADVRSPFAGARRSASGVAAGPTSRRSPRSPRPRRRPRRAGRGSARRPRRRGGRRSSRARRVALHAQTPSIGVGSNGARRAASSDRREPVAREDERRPPGSRRGPPPAPRPARRDGRTRSRRDLR